MIELLDLEGNNGASLVLYGVHDLDEKLIAHGYLLKAPKAKRIPDPNVKLVTAFFKPTVPKPLRRGCVFRRGKDKYKCMTNLQVDKVMFYPILMEEILILEKVV